MNSYNRRNFIKASVAGGIGATLIRPFDTFASIGAVQNYSSEVALTTGDNRLHRLSERRELFLNRIMFQ